MKKFVFTLLSAAALFLFTGAFVFGSGDREESDLVIYAYDSFVSEWGPGPRIIPLFEEATGYSVDLISAGDAGQVLSRAVLEKDDPRADILLGIDNNLLPRALGEGVLEPYLPKNISTVPERLLFDETGHIIPYDYGYFSIIYDSEKLEEPPRSLSDLVLPQYKDSLILMDPRTSSPGLGFLLWSVQVFGDDFRDYWRELSPSILTVTEGWDAGYGLFTSGEAPMVLSYTTSPAYHLEYEDSQRYKVALFDDGHYIQIEGMGIVRNAPHREAAEAFIEFMLSEEAQSILPLTNWMYPVSGTVDLPECYSAAPKPEIPLMIDPDRVREMDDEWIDGWLETLSR